jgi:Flp pilus assembly protein TadG
MLTTGERVEDIRRSLDSEEGAILIEAAVSFALMIALIMAVFQFSLALYSSHFVADAAREASRYAIVRGSSSCSDSPNLTNCNATAEAIQSWVRNLNYPGINPQNLTVTTTWPSSGVDCYPSASPCNNPGNLVNVVVTYGFPLNVPFWKSVTINLRSTSQMVISQ